MPSFIFRFNASCVQIHEENKRKREREREREREAKIGFKVFIVTKPSELPIMHFKAS